MVRRNWLVAMGLVGFLLSNSYMYGALIDIHKAAAKGQTPIVFSIIKADKKSLNKQNKAGYTALHSAATNGHLKTVTMLIKNGAKINIKNTSGNTALHLAVMNGHLDLDKIVKVLIENGADVNIRNNKYERPTEIVTAAELGTMLESAPTTWKHIGATWKWGDISSYLEK